MAYFIYSYEDGNQFSPNGIMFTGERVITIEGSVDAICAAEVALSKRLRDYMDKDMKNANNSQMVFHFLLI